VQNFYIGDERKTPVEENAAKIYLVSVKSRTKQTRNNSQNSDVQLPPPTPVHCSITLISPLSGRRLDVVPLGDVYFQSDAVGSKYLPKTRLEGKYPLV